VTVGTFVGIGALARDFGFSITWAVLSTALIWAAPAQLILLTGLGSGAALVEIALAVALSALRLLPMAVSLIPLLRAPRTGVRHLLFPAHLVTVTIWVEGLRLLPGVPREDRVAYLNGMGGVFLSVAMLFTAVGFYLAAALPTTLSAALIFLTPISFLLSLVGNSRAMVDRLAMALGLVIAPVLAAYGIGLDILWGGIIGGTLAYGAHRLRERRR
jgi:predicted branched-subunit amino acid permease